MNFNCSHAVAIKTPMEFCVNGQVFVSSSENRIKDIMELEHLKPLLNLSSLFIDPNPMTYVGIWRSMVILTLPQIQVLDRKTVKLEESVR